MILGVLHHLSDWRAALDRACRTVRPGGFLLLHEAVTKPRVLGRWRSRGVDDDWVSPHEGDVPRAELLASWARAGSSSASTARSHRSGSRSSAISSTTATATRCSTAPAG